MGKIRCSYIFKYLCFILILCASFGTIANDDQDEQYRKEVIQLSEAYFKNISEGKYEVAYVAIADSLRAYLSESAFTKSKREFRDAAISVIKITIPKVTLYRNPASAPEPGIYIAADYNNEFSGLPVHCGFLVWFRTESDNKFLIVREESGFVTKAQFEQIVQADQLASVKKGLKCAQP